MIDGFVAITLSDSMIFFIETFFGAVSATIQKSKTNKPQSDDMRAKRGNWKKQQQQIEQETNEPNSSQLWVNSDTPAVTVLR